MRTKKILGKEHIFYNCPFTGKELALSSEDTKTVFSVLGNPNGEIKNSDYCELPNGKRHYFTEAEKSQMAKIKGQ